MPVKTITIPSKTFLLGEYAVLFGASAIVMCTTPYFKLTIEPTTENELTTSSLIAQSPAGKFYAQHEDFFKQFNIEFATINYKGGLGASSAEFLSLYALKQQWHYHAECIQDPQAIADLLQTFQLIAWNGEGLAPSGVDLIAQCYGGIHFLDKSNYEFLSLKWPFAHCSLLLVHTQIKQATHMHLASLSPARFTDRQIDEMDNLVRNAKDGLLRLNFDDVIESINEYAHGLEQAHLVCDHTLQLLEQLRCLPGVKLAKGCGAMGADVILLAVGQEYKANVIQYLHTLNLPIIADETMIAPGLLIEEC